MPSFKVIKAFFCFERLPTGLPPYKANKAPVGTQHTWLADESKKLWHLSNFVASEEVTKLGEKLTDNTFADKVFFCNSGSEANEAAIKIVRKFHSSINQDKTLSLIHI